MILNGALAGLVAITASPDTPSALASVIIGVVAGVLVVFSILGLDKLRIDDPVGAFSVHGTCGIWATLAVGLFNTDKGLFTGHGFSQLGVQIVAEEDEHMFDFDLLDATKLIPESLVPVQLIGKLTLNRNPDNYFAETEQVAFHPGHLVPGIDFSNDPLLQGRLFSYSDTQLSRLGSPNFHEIPINRPIAVVANNQRDGHMRQDIIKGRVSYEPNTLGGGCPMQSPWEQGGFVSHAEPIHGAKDRVRSPSFADHFSQPGLFWRSQADWEQAHIVGAFCFELGKVSVPAIRERMLANVVPQLESESLLYGDLWTRYMSGVEAARKLPAGSLLDERQVMRQLRDVASLPQGAVPPDQAVSADLSELTEHAWVKPALAHTLS